MRYHKEEQSQDLSSVRALKLQLPYLSFVMWGWTLWCHPSCPSSVPLGAHCLKSKTKLFMGSMHRGVQGPTVLHCSAGYNRSSPPCCTWPSIGVTSVQRWGLPSPQNPPNPSCCCFASLRVWVNAKGMIRFLNPLSSRHRVGRNPRNQPSVCWPGSKPGFRTKLGTTDRQTDRQTSSPCRSGRGCHRVADSCGSFPTCFPGVRMESFLSQHQALPDSSWEFCLGKSWASISIFVSRDDEYQEKSSHDSNTGLIHQGHQTHHEDIISDSQPIANLISLIHSQSILLNAGR